MNASSWSRSRSKDGMVSAGKSALANLIVYKEGTMASNRIGRINEEIQRELAELIRSLKDPRVQTMISITRVDTTPDLRYSKIYVSVLEEARSQDAIRGLKSAGGWLRRELGSRLQLRYTPELVFTLDDSLKYGAHMFDLLEKLERQEAAREAEKANDEG
ncbi:MAG: 30S ribosome-binding factor RbfA [Acutalibacteraceae bacterium]